MEEAGSFVRSAVDGHLGRLQDALSGSTLSDVFCSQPLASVHIYVDDCANYHFSLTCMEAVQFYPRKELSWRLLDREQSVHRKGIQTTCNKEKCKVFWPEPGVLVRYQWPLLSLWIILSFLITAGVTHCF